MYDFLRFWRTPPVRIRQDAELKLLESDFAVRFAYHSGRTENEDISWDDTLSVFETGTVSNFSGRIQTLFEIVGARNAWDKALDLVYDPSSTLGVREMLSLHAVLMEGCYDGLRTAKGEAPGTFKKGFYVVGPLETGCAPEDAAAEMEGFLREIRPFWNLNCEDGYEENTVLKAAAWAHCRFENIHAFADGNGRLGRLLLNMLLMRNAFPPVVFDFQEKARYCDALQAYHERETIRPFMDFLVDSLEHTWRCHLHRPDRTLPDRTLTAPEKSPKTDKMER